MTKRVLDARCAEVVKERDGKRCCVCRHEVSGRACHWAHVFSRRYLNTRWDLQNSLVLCRSCHYRYTLRPEEWMHYVEGRMGRERFERLRARAFAVVGKVDLEAWGLYLANPPEERPW